MADSLNGEFIYILLIAVVDAAILAWLVLKWYRRAIARIMAMPPEAGRTGAVAATPPLVAGRADTVDHVPVSAIRVRRRLIATYVAASLAWAAVTGGANVVAAGNLVPPAFAAVIWAHAWPVWPALAILLACDRWQSIRLLALYLLAGAIAVAAATLIPRIMRGTVDLTFLSNIYWAVASLIVTSAAGLVLIAITSVRRIRAVMPLALSGTIVFGIGLLLFRRAIVAGFNNLTFRSAMLELSGMSSTQVAYYSIYFVLALPFGWCAWQALRWLAHAYARKRFSDIQLLVDCWFAVATAAAVIMDLLVPFGLSGVGIGVIAFSAYRITIAVMLRMRPLRSTAPGTADGLRLLVLRVFGFQRRTETLFDQLSRRWRFHGPVQLIGGTDLAMRTVDPGEVLRFIEGRLHEQYVSSIESVPQRLESLDLVRDPDGRFRVNDIYCLNDTWQTMFEAMLAVTDRVVMDLRGFSQTNAGCRFELEQLVLHLPAEHIVLVTDHTTDEALLKQIVAAPVSIVSIDRDLRGGIGRIVANLLKSELPAPPQLPALV